MLQVRLVDEEFVITDKETLHIRSLNLTFDKAQYELEICIGCSQGNAIWVCAEDLNPDWWKQHVTSSASFVPAARGPHGRDLLILFIVCYIAF